MRRAWIGWSVVVGLTLGLAEVTRADSLKLAITGYAFNTPVNQTVDVTSGFPGLTLALGSAPIGAVYGTIPPGSSMPIQSSIDLHATLFNATQNLAGVNLIGAVTGQLNHAQSNPNIDGALQGLAPAGPLSTFGGVDPASLPAWFPNLSATLAGAVSGGSLNLLNTRLTIAANPGPAHVSVPEPATLITLALGALVILRHTLPTRPISAA